MFSTTEINILYIYLNLMLLLLSLFLKLINFIYLIKINEKL